MLGLPSLMGEDQDRNLNGDHGGLFEYAVRYWSRHYNMIAGEGKVSLELRNKALGYLGSGWALATHLQDTASLPSTRDLLRNAVLHCCDDLILPILNDQPPDKSDIDSALELAITNGNEDIVNSLTSASAGSPSGFAPNRSP